MATTDMAAEKARQKGTAELLILAQLEGKARHGYEIGLEIERRSGGVVCFQVASLYPVLYRLERKGLISGQWVEKAGERRRRFYKLTPQGKKTLAEQRQDWATFLNAFQQTAGLQSA